MPGVSEKLPVTEVKTDNLIPLNDKEFELIRDLVYSRFGINLTEQKRSLIAGRLNRTLRQNGIDSFRAYYDYVISDQTGQALSKMVDKISTNHTFFYREKEHFDYLRDTVLPELTRQAQKSGKKVMRIWCAASSSGEEPYTLAMLLCEYFKSDLAAWDVGILATDISFDILESAKKGIYDDRNVSQLPKELRNRYLKKLPENMWEVNDKIKELVLFRRLNLMRQEFPFRGKFQVIFSRNVMIYFDEPTRESLVKRYHRYMEPGGYLFIGHSETLGRNNKLYRFLKPAVYRMEPINE